MTQPTTAPLPGAGVPLTLDRQRTLRFTMTGAIELKKLLGQNPLQAVFWQDFGADNPEKMRAALWALLIHEDPGLTIDQAGNLLAIDRLQEISTALVNAITAGSPPKKTEPVPATA